MPTNEVYKEAAYIPLTVGASVPARQPVIVGKIPGVTLTATGASGTQVATVATEGVFKLSVVANDGGATTIAVGDILYWSGTNASPTVNKNAANTRFGYAMDANSGSGTTTTIKVLIGY
jgi:predicted RecA/RadA family phage recombinase